MSIIRMDTKSFVGSLFILAVFLAMLPASFAKDYETPHEFKAGDVISADMVNELFSEIKNSNRTILSSDLVGTWSCTQVTLSTDYEGSIGATQDADGLIQTRNDTVTFRDDMDGTYSWQSQTYSSFWSISAETTTGPSSGSYLIRNGIIVFSTPSTPWGTQLGVFHIDAVSPTRYIITGIGDINRKLNNFSCDKQILPPAIPTDLSATTSGLTVTLTWTDNSNDETGFKIMRRDSLEGEYNELTTTAADVTSYDDTVPSAGDYWYRIKSTNNNGDSLGSNVVKVTVAE